MQYANSRRDHYRLKYPKKMRPSVIIDGRRFVVTELSERGMRFEVARPIGAPSMIKGILVLDDDQIEFEGELCAFRGDEAIVTELTGVTFKRIMDEQRKILTIFPIV